MNGSGPTSGQAASGLSLASIGFQALGNVTSAEGTAAGDKYKAAELDRAAQYFDSAIAMGGGKNAGPFVAKAENIAQAQGQREAFELLLRQAIGASELRRDLAPRPHGRSRPRRRRA